MPSARIDAGDTAQRLDPGRGLTDRLVTLPDGRRLRAVVTGTGSDRDRPLVVFEAGMSAPAASWVHTQREVSAHARTLAYDRAGYGGSDPDSHDRTLERIVDDLTALLDAAGEASPVVLVGHSWGGPIIRLFAEQHPHRVAGMVFVDATVAEIMPARNAKLIAASFAVMSLLARFGGRDLIRRVTLPHGASPDIAVADMDIMLRDYACAKAMKAGRREAAQIASALPTIRRLQAAGTPDVPTVCLQAGRVERGMKRARPLFNQTVEDLMAATPDGRAIVVEGAGHLLPQEQPAAVSRAICEILDAVEARQARREPTPGAERR